MATEVYLAMTQSEFDVFPPDDTKMAWLSCHLSPSGAGLDGMPPALPSGSLLILTDEIPFQDHDPAEISAELYQVLTSMNYSGLLLDFQQPRNVSLAELAQQLSSALPCPVAVSEPYARDLDCPVFLSPCPHHVHLRDHISPWADRELWLDLATDAETITVTPSGSVVAPLLDWNLPEDGYCEESLHCHYRIETGLDFVRFTLWRTRADLEALIQEGAELGIANFVGLWSEWASAK